MGYSIGYRTKDEILKEARDAILSQTPLTALGQNSVLSGILSAFAEQQAKMYADIEANFAAQYLRTAIGSNLDNKAEDFGLRRQTSYTTFVPCSARVMLLRTKDGTKIWSSLSQQGGTYRVIPRGVRVTSSIRKSLIMSTYESSFFNPDTISIPIGISGEIADTEKIPAGTLDQFDFSAISAFDGADLDNLEIVQVANIIGIETVESDDELRGRIRSWSQVAAKANEQSLIDAVTTGKSDVAKVVIERGIRGTGSANLIAIPRYRRVPQSVMDSIQQLVDERRSFGEDIKVIQPIYIPVNMTLRVADKGLVNAAKNAVERGFEAKSVGGSMSHAVIKKMCSDKGVPVEVVRLEVDGVELLSSARIDALTTEMFELSTPVAEFNNTTSYIQIVVG
jgi:uncharacterized phage protein gp47/JayE